MHNRHLYFLILSFNISLLCVLLLFNNARASVTIPKKEKNTRTHIVQHIEQTTQDDIFFKELTLPEKIRYFDLLLLQLISNFNYDITLFSSLHTQKKTYKKSYYLYQELTIVKQDINSFLKEIIELEQLYPKSFSIDSINNSSIQVVIDGIITHTLHTPNASIKKEKDAPTYITIIIDDIGENIVNLNTLLQLPFPLTYALWPFSSKAQKSMNILKKNKQEMIIHMPMEPNGYPKIHSGKGTLLTTMNEESIHQQIKKAIETIPYSVGMNNHMGSKATQDANFVKSLLKYIKKEYPSFILVDSMTHPKSIFYSTARKMKMPTAKRHVFLDHTRTVEHTLEQLKETERLSKKYGKVLAIGHPASTTITALQKWSKIRNTKIEIISLKKFSKNL